MSDDTHPEDLAAQATQPRETTDAQPGPAPAPSAPTEETLLTRLLDGNARGPPADQLAAEYDLERGASMFLRGVLRVAGSTGMPPLGDMVLGVMLELRGRSVDGDRTDRGGDVEGMDRGGVPLEESLS